MKYIIKSVPAYLLVIVFSMCCSLQVNASASCDEIKNDLQTLKEKPGYYYYNIGLCEFQFIHDKQQFDVVADALTKSSKYDYAPSYFALGLLYDNRFNDGSLWLGSRGDITDLLKSIESYKKAVEHQSVMAENNLGEIYLHNANLGEYKSNNDSDDIVDVSEILPNLDYAIYWLERAAKHGNPAAQGTLSDLYLRGIGVPQDFVIAYVWQNMSVASQYRYNKNMQKSSIGRDLLNSQQEIVKNQYNELTEKQKDAAQILLNKYSKLYFKTSTELDELCQNIQSYISGTLAQNFLQRAHDIMSRQ